ncbi:hypothetical protein EDB83DRAFT_2356300 [Lactarius deliciosus]|nr:hypothetical protein EDB83DRAFT_2356300 [Lactarius deliciosus]
MQERVVPPVARAVSRLPSQQNGAKPARESSRVGGTSSYEQSTTNLDDRGPTSQERVVLPVARAVSRLPSQQNGTKPTHELPNQVGGASLYVVPPIAREISRQLSQQSGTKPARKSPQVGGASLHERSMTNVDDRGPTLQEWVVPPVARAVSRLPSQQSATRPAHESPDQVGGTSSYRRPTTNLDDRGPTSREQAGPPVARTASRLHSQQSGTNQAHESPQVGGAPSYKQPTRSAWATAKSPVSTVESAPQKVDEDWPTLMSQGSGAKSPVAQSGPSKASSKRPAARRPLNSTVRQVLSEDVKFRILVVGKSGSGKSSLVKAVFKVDVTAAPERTSGRADINAEFGPQDNRYLIVHECSGLDSQASDSQDLRTIRDFISHRTDPSCLPSERLHAVWVCIPASDVIAGRLGDGVKEILGSNVPVVIVFTKFDLVVSQVRLDGPSGEAHTYERTRARGRIEESCRHLFHKDPRDVPAEIVSGNLPSSAIHFVLDGRIN